MKRFVVSSSIALSLLACAAQANAEGARLVVNAGDNITVKSNITSQPSVNQGGAIFNEGIVTVLDGINFSGNSATTKGGAIYNAGTLNLGENVANAAIFENNTALDGGVISNVATGVLNVYGGEFKNNSVLSTTGGFAAGGAITNRGVLVVDGSKFTNNTAISNGTGSGGAITTSTSASAVTTVKNATFTGNIATHDGGAIANFSPSGLTVENSTFKGNIASVKLDENNKPVLDANGRYQSGLPAGLVGIGGGAIALGSKSATDIASITGALFDGNISGVNGGAIGTRQGSGKNDNSSATLDINATFKNNVAVDKGGAIYNSFYADNGLGKGDGVTVSGLFENNEAYNAGGAIFNDGAVDENGKGAVMTINNSTFKGNSANLGGAILNTGTLTIADGTSADNATKFIGNTATTAGGAIRTEAGGILNIGDYTLFDSNKASEKVGGDAGGALYITDSTLNVGDNVVFKGNNAIAERDSISGAKGAAGAAYVYRSDVTIGEKVTFENNQSKYAAGALYIWNDDGKTATIGNGATFKNNESISAYGGAIGNFDGKLTIGEGATFASNKAGTNGGAIANMNFSGSAVELNLGKDATFTSNSAKGDGGAIYNQGTLTVQGGTLFDGNSADGKGGAIYNAGTITLDSTNGDIIFQNNTENGSPNDIYMADNSVLTVQGDNTVSLLSGIDGSVTSELIKNDNGTLNLTGNNVHFEGKITQNAGIINYAQSETPVFKDEINLVGDDSEFNVVGDTTFEDKVTLAGANTQVTVDGTSSFAKEIAISGENSIMAISGDSTFADTLSLTADNTSLGVGGNLEVAGVFTASGDNIEIVAGGDSLVFGDDVILDGDNITLDSNATSADFGGDLEITGTNTQVYVNGGANVAGKVTVDGDGNELGFNGDTVFEDDVLVSNETAFLGINGTSTFMQDLTVQAATIGLYGNSSMQNFTIGSGIDMINNQINTSTVAGTMTIANDVNMAIDLNPANQTADRFVTTDLVTNNKVINVNEINLVSAPNSAAFSASIVEYSGTKTGDLIVNADAEYSGPIGTYKIFGSANTGMINGLLTSFNPKVFRGQVATVSQYANQLAINSMLFDHSTVITNELMASKRPNRYASSNPIFGPYQYSKLDGGVWLKTYGNFEKIHMSQNLNVGNNSYGALVGFDLPHKQLKKGWGFVPTVYAGYNGAHQYYNSVSLYQNGGQVGAMATLDKGNFLNTSLAYGGYYGNRMNVEGHSDNTGNWFWGVANKSAYNIGLTKHLALQPTFLMAFSQFGKQHWGTGYGAMGMESGMLNGFNVAPGANLIWQKENYSIYAMAQWMFNINGNVDGRAANVDLPNISMGTGYIEYGAGFTRKIKDRLTGYLQGTIRNGTRTGVGVQLGFNLSL